MNAKKFFYVMTGIITLMVVGSGVAFTFANTFLKQRSQSIVDLKLKNQTLDEQVNAYRIAKRNLADYQDLSEIVDRIVPSEKDQARVVRELTKLAKDSGFEIASITFPASNLGVKPLTGATGGTASGSTTTPTPAAPTAAPAITQAKPVEGLKGVYAIETTVAPLQDSDHKITYRQVLRYLDKLELNRRTMQVTAITINPGGPRPSDGVTFTLTLNIFVKP